MCKKIIALFATVILIFNVIFPSVVRAEKVWEGNSNPGSYEKNKTYGESSGFNDMQMGSQDEAMETLDGGRAKVGDDNNYAGYDISDDSVNSLLKNLVKFFNVIPSLIRGALTIVTYDSDPTYVDDEKYGETYSIQKTVFGKIRMFDVNFLHREENEDALSKVIKDQVAKFYYITRNISIGLLLIVLIYTGIRMALATIASEIAKYKTLLKDWIVALVILMTLQYFMVAIIKLGEIASNICETIMCELIEDDDEYRIEEKILEQSTTVGKKGWSIIVPTIIYWLLTWYQLKFFLMYCRRLMMMAFLVAIAPFITVSYSIDKAGDGQAQALKTWLSEFAMGILIQPLQAFIYMIFMLIASKIMSVAPILSIIFINYLDKAEKLVRSLFRVKDGLITAGMKEAGEKLEKKS